uniref:Uncharacterized protein n=1 Tax=Arundo donax TaxID=35708 RepID=A0A0A9C0N9_ARUDO
MNSTTVVKIREVPFQDLPSECTSAVQLSV